MSTSRLTQARAIKAANSTARSDVQPPRIRPRTVKTGCGVFRFLPDFAARMKETRRDRRQGPISSLFNRASLSSGLNIGVSFRSGSGILRPASSTFHVQLSGPNMPVSTQLQTMHTQMALKAPLGKAPLVPISWLQPDAEPLRVPPAVVRAGNLGPRIQNRGCARNHSSRFPILHLTAEKRESVYHSSQLNGAPMSLKTP